MTDSFFTARTSADLQYDGVNVPTCEFYLEASLRRIVKIEGPLEAAKKMQRLADICAGVHVMPIEHWRKPEAPKPADAPLPAIPGYRLDKRFDRFVTKYPMLLFYLGMAAGWWIWGQSVS
ncbi:hypothetical protein LB531_21685 [Mesorhizobium sp. CO1-1-2]|uniref:hypothetical protein n=1 Tax=Mesorhizobium sp. CO1-1-2 TaxID=2876635 RepID=UPI001CCD5AEE|nr:hypothetical protein [Mesorhizobium sp. CO1-1-2]MBZ9683273.1 hypothetical protein [Mesorhizobium sp. CO1-1-2]